jgi:hypothetical protein
MRTITITRSAWRISHGARFPRVHRMNVAAEPWIQGRSYVSEPYFSWQVRAVRDSAPGGSRDRSIPHLADVNRTSRALETEKNPTGTRLSLIMRPFSRRTLYCHKDVIRPNQKSWTETAKRLRKRQRPPENEQSIGVVRVKCRRLHCDA